MDFERITEQDSHYRHLDKMSTSELLKNINAEDRKVAHAVEKSLPQVEKLIDALLERMVDGGRLFYIGAGTSGRLGVLDASECVPTFGVPKGLVIGVIAGGQHALENAVEFAEDNPEQGWLDLQQHHVSDRDFVVGLSAGGTAPYVIGALETCRNHDIGTGSITCNPGAPLSRAADFPVEIPVGPEFVTGSTRMKSGTAQKMVLNMITTTAMIQLGRVEDNKMVNMQLTNQKLIDRGVRMLMEKMQLTDPGHALELLQKHGSVKKALSAPKNEK